MSGLDWSRKKHCLLVLSRGGLGEGESTAQMYCKRQIATNYALSKQRFAKRIRLLIPSHVTANEAIRGIDNARIECRSRGAYLLL